MEAKVYIDYLNSKHTLAQFNGVKFKIVEKNFNYSQAC